MRKKKAPEAENHERWLVSYADFITLLFAFFVVMFASSQTDKSKAKQVSDSVREALEQSHLAAAVASILGGTVDDIGKGNAMMKGPGGTKPVPPPKQEPKPPDLPTTAKQLAVDLKAEIDAGKIKIQLEPRGLVISLREAAFFASGDDVVAPGAWGSMEKISKAVSRVPNPARLEGHTDSIPIHNSRFRSNWELSAARAIAMMEMLGEDFKVPRERMAISGYAETVPVDSNETPEGRARNRRVDIVLLSAQGAQPEPQPHATTSSGEPEKNAKAEARK